MIFHEQVTNTSIKTQCLIGQWLGQGDFRRCKIKWMWQIGKLSPCGNYPPPGKRNYSHSNSDFRSKKSEMIMLRNK